jgi:hypothetical protein
MAGEKIAKFYESLTAIAVKAAIKESAYNGLNVYREVKLPGVSIRNDVIVAESKEIPRIIFLVTHSTLEVHWKEKVQRDLAESIEVICEYPEIDGIFYVIYDDRTLPGLTKILNYALSGVINVSDFDTEGVISSLGRKKHFISRLDSLDESKRQQKINTYFNSNKKLKVILDMMVDVIRVRIDKILPENLDAGGYIPLTRVNIKKRKSSEFSKSVRNTRFNRSLSKLAFFSDTEILKIKNNQLLTGDYLWATADIYWPVDNKSKGQLLSRVGKTGFRCADPEIMGGPLGSKKSPIIVDSIFDSLELSEIRSIVDSGRKDMADIYEKRIRGKAILNLTIEYIKNNKNALRNGAKLGRLLKQVSLFPQDTFWKYCDESKTHTVTWNWLYTGLVAFFKATAKTKHGIGTKQGYGYSKISAGMKTPRFKSAVEHSILQHLEYCMNPLDSDLINEVAESMSKWLSKISSELFSDQSINPYRFLLLSEVEDKYLPSGIDVIPAMIERAANKHGLNLLKKTMTNCLAVASDAGGTAGRSNVYRVKDTIIWYKASHLRQNVLHKRKEIQTIVSGWWQTWDDVLKTFHPTTDFKKTILVIDGDWQEDDLSLLHDFGWDEFLYPDELHRLPELIV